jgi:hypothetical protein
LATFLAGGAFLATTFLTALFFATGLLFGADLLLLFPALAPFLGARDTATIHPLFLGLKLFAVSLNRPTLGYIINCPQP